MPDRVLPLQPGTYTLSSPYGGRVNPVTGRNEGHLGLDFAANDGTKIYAAQAGTVQYIGGASGFGQWIVLDHDDSQGSGCTVYGHMWNAFATGLRVGSKVAAGQHIAYVGSNGQSTGAHLHFEVHPVGWAAGSQIDPAPWLRGARAPLTAPPTSGGTKPMGEFQCDIKLITAADDGLRPMPPSLQVIHTNEPGNYKGWGANPGSVLGLLQFCANTGNGASYHTIVGRAGDTGRCNDDSYAPWAAGTTGNRRGLHLCAMGWSAQNRDEWLSYDAQLNGIARVLAHNSVVYGIPLVKLSAADVRAGKRGVCGHGEVSVAWGEVDHTDPGPAFPFDVVLNKAQAIVDGKPNSGGFLMALNDAEQREVLEGARQWNRGWKRSEVNYTPGGSNYGAAMLTVVADELTKKFPSRSKYANDPTKPIDTLAGFELNVDGRIHEMSVDLPKKLDALQQSIDNLPSAIAAAVVAALKEK